jgi:hypothetical protein
MLVAASTASEQPRRLRERLAGAGADLAPCRGAGLASGGRATPPSGRRRNLAESGRRLGATLADDSGRPSGRPCGISEMALRNPRNGPARLWKRPRGKGVGGRPRRGSGMARRDLGDGGSGAAADHGVHGSRARGREGAKGRTPQWGTIRPDSSARVRARRVTFYGRASGATSARLHRRCNAASPWFRRDFGVAPSSLQRDFARWPCSRARLPAAVTSAGSARRPTARCA